MGYISTRGTLGNRDWGVAGTPLLYRVEDLTNWISIYYVDPTGSIYTTINNKLGERPHRGDEESDESFNARYRRWYEDVAELCTNLQYRQMNYQYYNFRIYYDLLLDTRYYQLYANVDGYVDKVSNAFTMVTLDKTVLTAPLPIVGVDPLLSKPTDCTYSSPYFIQIWGDWNESNDLSAITQELLDPDGVEEDPEDEPYDDEGNTPIEPYIGPGSYVDVIGQYMSVFNIVAEIDATNLGYLADALNNRVTLDDSVTENLGNIARGLLQKNILEGIISLKIIPIVSGNNLQYKTGSEEVLFLPFGTHTVRGKKLATTIQQFNLTQKAINPIFNDYRDYLCDYSIYLPFSGIHHLDADAILGKTLVIKADIDYLMGSILYHVSTSEFINDQSRVQDIYTFTGSCGIDLPISQADFSGKYQAIMNGIFTGIGSVAGAATGGPAGAAMGATLLGGVGAGIQSIGSAGSALEPHYIQSGHLIPNVSAMSVLYPYMIVSKPIDHTPNIAHTKGLPCHKTGTLSQFTGFTIATQCDLSGIQYATDDEKESIRSMLASGVYL